MSVRRALAVSVEIHLVLIVMITTRHLAVMPTFSTAPVPSVSTRLAPLPPSAPIEVTLLDPETTTGIGSGSPAPAIHDDRRVATGRTHETEVGPPAPELAPPGP